MPKSIQKEKGSSLSSIQGLGRGGPDNKFRPNLFRRANGQHTSPSPALGQRQWGGPISYRPPSNKLPNSWPLAMPTCFHNCKLLNTCGSVLEP